MKRNTSRPWSWFGSWTRKEKGDKKLPGKLVKSEWVLWIARSCCINVSFLTGITAFWRGEQKENQVQNNTQYWVFTCIKLFLYVHINRRVSFFGEIHTRELRSDKSATFSQMVWKNKDHGWGKEKSKCEKMLTTGEFGWSLLGVLWAILAILLQIQMYF